jgi:hypothetical protein
MVEKPTANLAESAVTGVNHEKQNVTSSRSSDSPDDAVGPKVLNIDAFKSDESDGKINWTISHRIAAFALCLLYVGECDFGQ